MVTDICWSIFSSRLRDSSPPALYSNYEFKFIPKKNRPQVTTEAFLVDSSEDEVFSDGPDDEYDIFVASPIPKSNSDNCNPIIKDDANSLLHGADNVNNNSLDNLVAVPKAANCYKHLDSKQQTLHLFINSRTFSNIEEQLTSNQMQIVP